MYVGDLLRIRDPAFSSVSIPRLEIFMLAPPPEFPTGLRAWVLRLSSDARDTRRSRFMGGGEHEGSSSRGATSGRSPRADDLVGPPLVPGGRCRTHRALNVRPLQTEDSVLQ